jgi:hypothetical protein
MKLTKTDEDVSLYGDKCNFYLDEKNKTVVCTTVYKNESIKGLATCSPEDEFDISVGKALAYARCKQKLAKRKLLHAQKVYSKAAEDEARANKKLLNAFLFVRDSEEYLKNSNEYLSSLIVHLED